MKVYSLFLLCLLIHTYNLFSAQAASEDKKFKLLSALAEVEHSHAVVFKPEAVIGYELDIYRRKANSFMRIVLENDAPEKATMQTIGEEYFELSERLTARSPTPRSEESIKRFDELYKNMEDFIYTEGMGNKLKAEQGLGERLSAFVSSVKPEKCLIQ